MCDPRVCGVLLFRCMVAGLCWHFFNFSWLCKVFLQTSLHFASQFRNLKAISTFRGDFAAISKLGGDFAAEKYFRRPFRSLEVISQPISQLRNEENCAAKWHSCAKEWFCSYETPFQMASRLRNSRSTLCARL